MKAKPSIKPPVIIGYWRRSKDEASNLPWPIVEEGYPNRAFIERAEYLETLTTLTAYRGFTVSRLTGKPLGSTEHEFFDKETRTTFRWPYDYVPHYLRAGVAPDEAFVELVNRVYRKALSKA